MNNSGEPTSQDTTEGQAGICQKHEPQHTVTNLYGIMSQRLALFFPETKLLLMFSKNCRSSSDGSSKLNQVYRKILSANLKISQTKLILHQKNDDPQQQRSSTWASRSDWSYRFIAFNLLTRRLWGVKSQPHPLSLFVKFYPF